MKQFTTPYRGSFSPVSIHGADSKAWLRSLADSSDGHGPQTWTSWFACLGGRGACSFSGASAWIRGWSWRLTTPLMIPASGWLPAASVHPTGGSKSLHNGRQAETGRGGFSVGFQCHPDVVDLVAGFNGQQVRRHRPFEIPLQVHCLTFRGSWAIPCTLVPAPRGAVRGHG